MAGFVYRVPLLGGICQLLPTWVRTLPVAIPAPETSTLQTLPLQGGAHRLPKAANKVWISCERSGGCRRATGLGRTPRNLSPTLSRSPAPWASSAQRLRRLFVKRGRGSPTLARPRSCLQCPQGVAAPRPDPPPQTCCCDCSGSCYYRRPRKIPQAEVRTVQAPSRRAPSSPPPSTPPPPPLGPLLTGGGDRNPDMRSGERGSKGGAWRSGSRKARRVGTLKLQNTCQTPAL